MAETITKRLRAEQLKPGDLLIPTRRTVVANRGAGLRTPSGKVDLTLREKGGRTYGTSFGKHTAVVVERRIPTEQEAEDWDQAVRDEYDKPEYDPEETERDHLIDAYFEQED